MAKEGFLMSDRVTNATSAINSGRKQSNLNYSKMSGRDRLAKTLVSHKLQMSQPKKAALFMSPARVMSQAQLNETDMLKFGNSSQKIKEVARSERQMIEGT